ncbi:MAG: M20/M25/M40 family metallo-hydrolase, partial [Actinomycetota bacterium]|nr:M20/M25/M40 family metallo-hydrolase [Actinomycetota bacterium]
AEAHVRGFLASHLERGDTVELVDHSPAAAPGMSHPLLRTLAERNGLEVRSKLGWTDVAFFAEQGVPAVNLGPGEATLAHTDDERIERSSVEGCYAALRNLLETGV